MGNTVSVSYSFDNPGAATWGVIILVGGGGQYGDVRVEVPAGQSSGVVDVSITSPVPPGTPGLNTPVVGPAALERDDIEIETQGGATCEW